jgi:hypothetical protein
MAVSGRFQTPAEKVNRIYYQLLMDDAVRRSRK